MGHELEATQAGTGLGALSSVRVMRDAPRVGTRAARGATPWLDFSLLALVYVVSIASLAGYATFSLHPELLERAGVAPATYGRILAIAPRAQILIAVAALAVVLVRHTGWRWAASFAAVYVVSLGAELAGTTVGLPFGPYRYTDGLGIKWFEHVPVLIPASWFMMALPSFALAARRFRGAGTTVGRVALGSFILLSWDLALDPAMSFATKYWVWGTDGPYYGMPVLNLVGWFVTGIALMIVFAAMRVDAWLDEVPISWLIGFYGANLLLPVGMSMAVGAWGAVLATGGALAFAWVIARAGHWRGRVA